MEPVKITGRCSVSGQTQAKWSARVNGLHKREMSKYQMNITSIDSPMAYVKGSNRAIPMLTILQILTGRTVMYCGTPTLICSVWGRSLATCGESSCKFQPLYMNDTCRSISIRYFESKACSSLAAIPVCTMQAIEAWLPCSVEVVHMAFSRARAALVPSKHMAYVLSFMDYLWLQLLLATLGYLRQPFNCIFPILWGLSTSLFLTGRRTCWFQCLRSRTNPLVRC